MRSTAAAAGLGLTLCLVAAGFAATPLYLPGVALLLIAAAATTWVRTAARGVRLVRFTGSPAIEEQAPLPVTVSVSRQAIPLPGSEIRAWPGAPITPVSADGTTVASVQFPRRGRHRLGPASLLISDPLGLCRREVPSEPDDVLVLPRIEPIRAVEMGGEAGILGPRSIGASDAGATEVDSLRPHRPGTPASRIHWPTVARTTLLMERRLVADGDHRPLVVVDPRGPSSAEALDQAVRAAASLCVHLARRGGCALLLPGDRRSTRLDADLYGFAELHGQLALLEPNAGAPPLGAVAGAQVILWVTANAAPASAVAQLRATTRYLVSPHAQPGPPVCFTVAGCSAQRLDRDAGRSAAA